HQPKANRNRIPTDVSLRSKRRPCWTAWNIQRHASLRQLSLSTADSLDDFADCIDHELRLFLVYFVAAIRVGNVLFAWHKLGEPFMRFLLCRIGDIAEVRWDIGW